MKETSSTNVPYSGLPFVKAKQVDPSVAGKANEYIERYSPHFPTKDEAFFRDITAGKSVKVGGWINETTTARFRD